MTDSNIWRELMLVNSPSHRDFASGDWVTLHGCWALSARYTKTTRVMERLDKTAGPAAFAGHVQIDSQPMISLTADEINKWCTALDDRARLAFENNEFSPITHPPKVIHL